MKESSLVSNLARQNHFLGFHVVYLIFIPSLHRFSNERLKPYRLLCKGNRTEFKLTFIFSSNYSLLKHTNYIHIYVLRNPAPHYKVRLQTCVYHIQRFELLVCLLIFFRRWQLGIDEINSIFLFFTPKETDVSHFHKVLWQFQTYEPHKDK